MQREICRLSVSADYVNSKGRNLLQLIDTNPAQPATLVRLDPTRGFVRRVESRGYSNYNGLLVGQRPHRHPRAARRAYTLSAYKTSTEAENFLIQTDDLNPDDSYALREQRSAPPHGH